MSRSSVWAISAIVAGFATACTEVASDEAASFPAFAPEAGVRCGAGRSCVEPSDEAFALSLEVTPPTGSRFSFRRFPFSDADAAVTVVSLEPPVTYAASVVYDSRQVAPADLLFVPDSPLHEPVFARARGPGFDLVHLYPGNYRVRIVPLDPGVPPLEVEPFTVSHSPSFEIQTKEFVLPTEFRELSGQVVSKHQADRGLAGVTVQATALVSELRSTEAVTDELGQFRLRLPTSTDTVFTLRASTPEEPWVFEQAVRLNDDEDRDVLVELEVPSVLERRRLRLQVLGPEGPVEGARVTLLTSNPELGEHTFLVPITGQTDPTGFVLPIGSGSYELLVLASTHRAVIEPPSGSPLASREAVLDLEDDGTTLSGSLQLQPSPVVHGVVSFEGTPVLGATVETFQITQAADTPHPRSAQTDASGHFELPIDLGEHLLYVAPGAGWAAATSYVTVRSAQGEPILIQLERSELLEVQIDAPSAGFDSGVSVSEPLDGFHISLWSTLGSQRVLLSNRAVTDTSGRVLLEIAR